MVGTFIHQVPMNDMIRLQQMRYHFYFLEDHYIHYLRPKYKMKEALEYAAAADSIAVARFCDLGNDNNLCNVDICFFNLSNFLPICA
jgi:hypothetical protein